MYIFFYHLFKWKIQILALRWLKDQIFRNVEWWISDNFLKFPSLAMFLWDRRLCSGWCGYLAKSSMCWLLSVSREVSFKVQIVINLSFMVQRWIRFPLLWVVSEWDFKLQDSLRCSKFIFGTHDVCQNTKWHSPTTLPCSSFQSRACFFWFRVKMTLINESTNALGI